MIVIVFDFVVYLKILHIIYTCSAYMYDDDVHRWLRNAFYNTAIHPQSNQSFFSSMFRRYLSFSPPLSQSFSLSLSHSSASFALFGQHYIHGAHRILSVFKLVRDSTRQRTIEKTHWIESVFSYHWFYGQMKGRIWGGLPDTKLYCTYCAEMKFY